MFNGLQELEQIVANLMMQPEALMLRCIQMQLQVIGEALQLEWIRSFGDWGQHNHWLLRSLWKCCSRQRCSCSVAVAVAASAALQLQSAALQSDPMQHQSP